MIKFKNGSHVMARHSRVRGVVKETEPIGFMDRGRVRIQVGPTNIIEDQTQLILESELPAPMRGVK